MVVVLLPSFPGTVILAWPFSRLASFSYFTGDGIVSTSTLSLAPTFTTLAIGRVTTSDPPLLELGLHLLDLRYRLW